MKNLKWKLVTKAKQYITKEFKKLKKHDFYYHNLSHTKRVVKAAKRISKNYDLSKNDSIVLLVSAWFHDIGYLEGISHHEEYGSERVEKFLIQEEIDTSLIPLFSKAILATRFPQNPSNLVEEILCDADLYHLGTASFFKISRSLKKELQLVNEVTIDKKEWLDKNIKLLNAQRYFTKYAKKELDKRLKKNLKKLVYKKERLSKVKEETSVIETVPS